MRRKKLCWYVPQLDEFEIFLSLRTHFVIGTENFQYDISAFVGHAVRVTECVAFTEPVVTHGCVGDSGAACRLTGGDDGSNLAFGYFDCDGTAKMHQTFVFGWSDRNDTVTAAFLQFCVVADLCDFAAAAFGSFSCVHELCSFVGKNGSDNCYDFFCFVHSLYLVKRFNGGNCRVTGDAGVKDGE